MPRSRKLTRQQIREWEPRFWVKLVGLVLIGCWLIGFVLENRNKIHLHFVLFTATVSLIWLILLILALGIVAGALLAQLHHRRRRDEPG